MIPPAGWRKGRLWADAEDSRRSYMLEHSGGLAHVDTSLNLTLVSLSVKGG